MQVAARKEPGRIDMPQYSLRAVFEAIVNAIAHRDYSIKGSSIRLLMFEDRLEIYSPGGLPNNLTLEGMSERQSTRNETLVSVLGRMRIGDVSGVESRQFFMERRGDGVPIILRETEELSGNAPKYRLVDDSEISLVIPAASVETSPEFCCHFGIPGRPPSSRHQHIGAVSEPYRETGDNRRTRQSHTRPPFHPLANDRVCCRRRLCYAFGARAGCLRIELSQLR